MVDLVGMDYYLDETDFCGEFLRYVVTYIYVGDRLVCGIQMLI